MLALMEVEGDAISAYGSADVDDADAGEHVVRVRGVVEKPKPEDAPSNLAVIGRYVFTPQIFEAIDQVKPGVGGEIQLTDAIDLLLDRQDVFGYRFSARPLRHRQQARLAAGDGRAGRRAATTSGRTSAASCVSSCRDSTR